MAVSEAEELAFARAAALGAAGLGTTSPNPSVGCVVLDDAGRIAGEGATAPPGGPHAEVTALRAAGDRARGGTAVVTLEPCNHTGRTGPCTGALIEAGVARVVYGEADPDPLAGGGSQALQAAGIAVERAPGRADYLTPWLRSVVLGRPFVTWKTAASLDGRTAAPDGTSRWITGAAARADVHALRARVDAVVVGAGTVLADDPALTVRRDDLPQRHPLRVAVDRRGRVPRTARVLDDESPSWHCRAETPGAVLAGLHERGIRHVLLEGGATLAGAFADAGLIDEAVAYIAPLLLGGGTPVLDRVAVATLTDGQRMELIAVDRVGGDVRITVRKTTTVPQRCSDQEA